MKPITIFAFGTRGDMQPACVLARTLRARGHEVVLATTPDFIRFGESFGLPVRALGGPFESVVRDPEFESLFRDYFSGGLGSAAKTLKLLGRLKALIADTMADTLAAVRDASVVVYNPFGYFAGAFARELGRPCAALLCQPLVPSRETPLLLLGRADLGPLANRASFELLRLTSPFLWSCLARARAAGGGRSIGLFTNPLALGLERTPVLLAYSRALAGPIRWRGARFEPTGFFLNDPVGETLAEPIEAFLAAGEPPVHVGFGSMSWGAKRNTDTVLRALELWGGRAILATGAGGLTPPDDLPANLLATRFAQHPLLFPRVRAVVHHGGPGTTAAALFAARPNVVLPQLGDQMYWGHRLAAAGAAEPPVLLGKVTADELARRIDHACERAELSDASGRIADIMAAEAGVGAGVALVERLSGQAARDRV